MQHSVSVLRQSVGTIFAIAVLTTALPSACRGSLIYYDTRPLFDAAQPGLPVQGFGGARLFGQPYVTEANGLNSATSDSVFAAGTILPGLTIGTLRPGAASTALEVYSGSIGNFWFGDTLVLSFAPGVSGVAANVFANTSSGASFAGNIIGKFFSGSTLLGSKTFTETAGGSVFMGAVSTAQPVTSVQLTWDSDGDASVFVNAIAFGTPASSTAAPEPRTTGLLSFGLLFLGLFFATTQRRLPAARK